MSNALGALSAIGGLTGNRAISDAASQVGSAVNKAAQVMGMSYRAAWGRLKASEAIVGEPLVEKTPGNKGFVLTALGKRLIQDTGSASQKIFNEVQDTVAKAMLGFEPQYTDASNDPTAPMRMQFLQQLMQTNPNVMGLMKQDERFKALLENYAKNLEMGVMQQQTKQVGRIGVKPVGA